jgi:UDP-N-acetylmuramoyl-tripeptide--D-alanyl-D-alanine ligase
MRFFEPDTLRGAMMGRWLRRAPDLELAGVGTDTREDLNRRAFIALRGSNHDGHSFVAAAAQRGAAMVVVERESVAADVPPPCGILLVENTRQALARLATAYRRTFGKTKVIAVTGSAGKTTTKALIDAALSGTLPGSAGPKSFNNEIGVPLTLLAARPTDAYVIVEIGTSAPGEVGRLAQIAAPDLGIITLVGRSHLEGLGTVEAVAREKASLLLHLGEHGVAVVNADVPLLRDKLKSVETRILYGESADADLRLTARGRAGAAEAVAMDDSGGGWWFEVNGRASFRLALPGRHNAINALAAVAVARRLGVPDEAISRGLGSVIGAPMRMAVHALGPWTIYNDAYNANPDSVIAAIDTFLELAAGARRRIVVLGDMLELGAAGPDLHREIGRHLARAGGGGRVDHAVLMGPLSGHTAEALRETWPGDRLTVLPEVSAVTAAIIAELLRPGDAVLLKGSRGTALERLLEWMKHRPGKAGAAAEPTRPRRKRHTRA